MSKGKTPVAITAGDLMAQHFPERFHIIDPWLRNGETALVWAASGVGKTMLSLSIAMAIATGGTVGPWSCPVARRVLYVDGEMHQQDVRDRVEMLRMTGAVKFGPGATLGESLIFVNRQGQDADTDFYDLTTDDGQTELLELVDRLKADVLILDNFTTLSDGLDDENAATSFKSIQRFLLATKQRGLTTLLIHHARKDGAAFRGSASIEVTFEVVLELQRSALVRMGGASFVPQFRKFRRKVDERLLPRSWALTDQGWDVSDDVEEGEDDPVLIAVRSRRFISQQDVAGHLGLSKGTVSKRLKRAVEMKIIRKEEIDECFASARRLSENPELEEPEEITDPDDASGDY